MDDDTVPEPDALRGLLAPPRAATRPGPPPLVASRVVWTDGRPHPMNTPRSPFACQADRAAAAAAGACRSARHRSCRSWSTLGVCRRRGLPEADYFLWNDDFEFTTRLLRGNTGLLCPASVVVHKTTTFGSTDVDPGDRFFYEVRNKVWMFRHPARRWPRRAGSPTPGRRCAAGPARSPAHATAARCAGLPAPRHRAGLRTSPRPTEKVLAEAGLRVPAAQQAR